MEWLQKRIIDETSENIVFVKEVGLPRNQFRIATAIICFQDVGQRQSFHFGLHPIDLQNIPEHNALQRDTFHSPNVH